MPNKHSFRPVESLAGPDVNAVAQAAVELGLAMNDKCDQLAKKLLGVVEIDPNAPTEEVKMETERSYSVVELELTKLRVRHLARMDIGGAVAAARMAGATWEQVGTACGSSKQAAYERWHKIVREFENARVKARQRPVDAVDQYIPAGAKRLR